MFRRIITAGAAAAVIVGAGTTALAVSGAPQTIAGTATQSTPSGQSTSNSRSGSTQSAAQSGRHGGKNRRAALRAALRRVAHAEFVTRGTDGFVQHDAVRGEVTSVSATSISVRAADGYPATFSVSDTTRVRKRSDSGGKVKGMPAEIGDVKTGDEVAVLGRVAASSSANPAATVIIDGVRK